MDGLRVREVLVPWLEGTPLAPAVRPEDKLRDAVALMAERGLTCLAVVRNGRPLGRVRLADALRALGLENGS